MPITEEEGVARRIFIEEKPFLVIHVIDAKNLERMLSFTLQLIEASLPVILVLNIMDEAKREGVIIDTKRLEREIGVPVVEAVATLGKGVNELKDRIRDYGKRL